MIEIESLPPRAPVCRYILHLFGHSCSKTSLKFLFKCSCAITVYTSRSIDLQAETWSPYDGLNPFLNEPKRQLSWPPSRTCFVWLVLQVRCLVLSQQAFEKQLGPLTALIDEERIKRENKPAVPMLQVIQQHTIKGVIVTILYFLRHSLFFFFLSHSDGTVGVHAPSFLSPRPPAPTYLCG